MTDYTELPTNIYAVLTADVALQGLMGGTVRIQDYVQKGLAYPRIEYRDDSASPIDVSCSNGHEHLFQIRVWSEYEGSKEALQLMARIKEILHQKEDLPSTTMGVVNLTYLGHTVGESEDNQMYLGIVSFRAVTEEI